MIRKITTQFLRASQPQITLPLAHSGLITTRTRFLFSGENDPNKDRPLSKQERFKQKEEQMLKESPEEDPGSYEKSSSNFGKFFMFFSIGGLLMFYGMMEIKTTRQKSQVDKSISGMTKIQHSMKSFIGGEWELYDTKGQAFASKNLQGSYYLIYFGFCNCPDICPNSLIKLSRAMQKLRKMPEFQYVKLKTIFVSVDPDRDTPEKIEKFLSYFDKDFIGVTGKSNDDPDLIEAMKKFKIYSNKIQLPEESPNIKSKFNYTIDHTVLTYLMSDTNQYIAHLGPNLAENEMAKQIMDKILDNEQDKMRMMQA